MPRPCKTRGVLTKSPTSTNSLVRSEDPRISGLPARADIGCNAGQVFAHEITLGGVLTSTRSLELKEGTTENQRKEDFKMAIGMSVTTVRNNARVCCSLLSISSTG